MVEATDFIFDMHVPMDSRDMTPYFFERESSVKIHLRRYEICTLTSTFYLVILGTLNLREWTIQEWTYRHGVARVHNAGVDNSAPCCKGGLFLAPPSVTSITGLFLGLLD